MFIHPKPFQNQLLSDIEDIESEVERVVIHEEPGDFKL